MWLKSFKPDACSCTDPGSAEPPGLSPLSRRSFAIGHSGVCQEKEICRCVNSQTLIHTPEGSFILLNIS